MNVARYACHGLGVLQPIDLLVADLHRIHPDQSWNIVGGFNPPLEEGVITTRVRADVEAGKEIVWIGHSMGAALGFYLPKAHPSWEFSLIITVDPMNWASNVDCAEWQNPPPHPGRWQAVGKFGRWINIRTRMPPGGGALVTADPRCEDHLFPELSHIGVISDPRVRKIIFDAVQKVGA